MEAFTLVIWWSVGLTTQEHRTPGLTEIDCKIWAEGVKAPKQSKCVREDIPSPDELPPADHRPAASEAGMGVYTPASISFVGPVGLRKGSGKRVSKPLPPMITMDGRGGLSLLITRGVAPRTAWYSPTRRASRCCPTI